MNKYIKEVLKKLKKINKLGLMEDVSINTTEDYVGDGITKYHVGTYYTIKFYRRSKHD